MDFHLEELDDFLFEEFCWGKPNNKKEKLESFELWRFWYIKFDLNFR